ncbi:hypothetical protein ACFSO7_01780 [Bacillus sp. CGMCC 1.16607]|uniref:hypothetical protein n=1 Tax=Bacillus sp. CGMCC 1.16607 TaxID=3351842 RepID=UPI00362D2F41
MILTILDKSYTYENSEKGAQELIELVSHILDGEKLHLSHFVINGQEIYEKFEDYIWDNITNINEIKIIVCSIKEFVGSLLVSLNTYLNRAIPEVKILINDFYQTPSNQSWLSLNQLLEGVDWIYQTIKSIDKTEHNILGWDEFIKNAARFEIELPNLLEALEVKDSILIADIIQYELLPQFQLIYVQTEKIFEEKLILK